MEPSQRQNRPRTITICSTNVSKERLATEIGILNSPYPTTLQLPTIDCHTRKPCDKLDPQVLLDQKYELPSHLQMGIVGSQHCCKCPVVRCIVDQRTTNQGLEFKISWEESWVPELDLFDLIRTSQTARDKLSRGTATVYERQMNHCHSTLTKSPTMIFFHFKYNRARRSFTITLLNWSPPWHIIKLRLTDFPTFQRLVEEEIEKAYERRSRDVDTSAVVEESKCKDCMDLDSSACQSGCFSDFQFENDELLPPYEAVVSELEA